MQCTFLIKKRGNQQTTFSFLLLLKLQQSYKCSLQQQHHAFDSFDRRTKNRKNREKRQSTSDHRAHEQLPRAAIQLPHRTPKKHICGICLLWLSVCQMEREITCVGTICELLALTDHCCSNLALSLDKLWSEPSHEEHSLAPQSFAAAVVYLLGPLLPFNVIIGGSG